MKAPTLIIVLSFWLGFSAQAQSERDCELTLTFHTQKSALTAAQMRQLEAFKKIHVADTLGKIKIAGASYKPNKSWKRINNVIDYLSDESNPYAIARIRFTFIICSDSMNDHTVVLDWCAEEEGPNMLPLPLPDKRF